MVRKMRERGDPNDIDSPEAADRFAIGLLSAGFGFLSGMIIWFAMPRAFDVSFSVFFWLSVILAAVFSCIGFFSPVFASRTLGNLWDLVRVLHRKIFFWIRLIK